MDEAEKKLKKVMNAAQEKAFKEAITKIPWGSKWKRVAVSFGIDRYVLDVEKYGLPYYELREDSVLVDGCKVTFVMPVLDFGYTDEEDYREQIAHIFENSCGAYYGPYYSELQALMTDSKKRGLPSFEGVAGKCWESGEFWQWDQVV